jgi:MFS family permease
MSFEDLPSKQDRIADSPEEISIALGTAESEKKSTSDATTRTDSQHMDEEVGSVTKGEPVVLKDSTNDEDQHSLSEGEEVDAPPFVKWLKAKYSFVFVTLFAGLLVAYSIWAYIIDWDRARPLFIIECTVAIYLLISFVSTNYLSKQIDSLETEIISFFKRIETEWTPPAVLSIVAMGIIAGVMVEEARDLVSALELIVFVLISYLTSWKPYNVKWRPVLGGM